MKIENLDEIRDKPLCDYGCGQQAIHQFNNGKCCCSKSQNSCPGKLKKNPPWNKGKTGVYSEEACKKISERNKGRVSAMKGKFHSLESRKKMSDSLMGNIPWNKGKTGVFTEEALRKISIGNSGKIMSEESRKKISNTLTGVPRSEEAKNKIKISIERIKEKYPTFSKIEEMRYEPGKEHEKVIQVHCKNSNCENSLEKGGWFTPHRRQLEQRIRAIEVQLGNGAGYLYCSKYCKTTCSIFNKTVNQLIKEDKINAGIIEDPWYTTTEYLTWRNFIWDLDNGFCVYCGEPAEHVHHIMPQKIYPNLTLDPDNGICVCNECHSKYGHRDERCTYGHLSQLVCERIIKIQEKIKENNESS